MKLVVGLGNPGRQYEGTRHNVGYRVVDELSDRWKIDLSRRRFSSLVGSGDIQGEQVMLLKPETYMNLSGRAVREAMMFHKLEIEHLLVVVDDMALPLGRLRIRESGSAGGHNGLTSLIQELGGDAYARLRIGIEAVEGKRMVGHVLGMFSKDEQPMIDIAIKRAADAVECWVKEGTTSAMNRFNKTD